MAVLPENPVKAPDRPLPPAHPARLILILSLAPIISLGIGRFAYSLVLPDMRDTLGWSYSAAGFMNTINAAGYLGGALVASKLIKRFGLSAAVRWSTLACVASLADPPAISDRMPVRPRCSSLPSQTAPNASGDPNARGRPGTRQNRRENCNSVFVVRPYFKLAIASCC